MTNEELEQWLDVEEDICIYRMYTKHGVKMRLRYAKWYYSRFGDCLQRNKDHWTQIILNPFVLGIIDIVDSIFYLLEHFLIHFIEAFPNIPVCILKILAKNKNPQVRVAVAMHKNTPLDVLEALSNDTCRYVRKAVARRMMT